MENFKTVLWDDSWHAKSWEGGHDEISGDTLCWEYGSHAGMKLPNKDEAQAAAKDSD